MNLIQTLAGPVGRVLLALIFVTSGFDKIVNYAGTAGYMEAMGVPAMLLPLVIVTELAGGLAVMLGWHTRLAALALAGFTVIAALLFHADFADPMQSIMFMKNIAIAGGLLVLVAHGAGAYALDNNRAAAGRPVTA